MKTDLGKAVGIPPSRAAGKKRRRASALNDRHCPWQKLGAFAFSLCLHLLIIATLAAEWQNRTEVVWVCTLTPEPAPADSTPPELPDLKHSDHFDRDEVTEKMEQKTDPPAPPAPPAPPGQPEQPEPVRMEEATSATQIIQEANHSSAPAGLQEPAANAKFLPLPMTRFSSARVPEQRRLLSTVSAAPVPPTLPLQQLRRDGRPSSMRGDLTHLASVRTVTKSRETETAHSALARQDSADAGPPHPAPFLRSATGAATSDAAVIKKDTIRGPGIPPSSSAGFLTKPLPDRQKPTQIKAAAVTQPFTTRQTVAGPPSTASEPVKPTVDKAENPTAEMQRKVPRIFEAGLKGDLELYVTGSGMAPSSTKIMVLFRPYPKRRHHIPMSMRQSRDIKSILPKISFTGKDTIQAVIEVASDGIYEFRGSEDTGPQEAKCTLTIHGTSSRPINKEIGTRKVGKDNYILKVMMPEGVLWDEDTSFSGTIKDSDGITKFNSETGLVWKEY